MSEPQVEASGRHFILCERCSEGIDPDDVSGVYLVEFGPQGLTYEDAVLVCAPWAHRRAPSLPFVCDTCKITVAVSFSALWFVERRRQRGGTSG